MACGFHDGELAVQARADVVAEAGRLAPMLDTPQLGGGLQRFLGERDFAAFTARAADGRLWVSPLFAATGFLDADDRELSIHALPAAGDPLSRPPANQPIGLVAIDFATRRRVRVNGTLVEVGPDGLRIEVDQAFGNCPKYIQQRQLRPARSEPPDAASASVRSERLTATQRRLIGRSDTFFLGTEHPSRGADASHRGGRAGFVRTVDGDLWWPDYAGNNMFNSLGNLASNDEAAMLFLDFDRGHTLHLSGTAAIEWTAPGTAGDDGHTGRRVRFHPDEIVEGPRLDLVADPPHFSPHDPPLT